MISFSIVGNALAQRDAGTPLQRGKKGRRTVTPLRAGIRAVRSGNYQKAATHLEKATSNNPNNPLAHYYLGISYMRMKESKEVRSSLQKAKQLFKTHGNKKGVKAVSQLLKRMGSK